MLLRNGSILPDKPPIADGPLSLDEAAMNELLRLVSDARTHLLNHALLEACSSLAGIPPVLDPLCDSLRRQWFQETSESVETPPCEESAQCGLYL